MIKNRILTEKKLIAAVGTIIKSKGYKGLSLNGVARVAGVNKNLIYRYFGDLDQLVITYLKEKDYWLGKTSALAINEEEFEEGDLLQQQVIHLLQNQLDYFYNEEEMQSLILSELSENNKLLQYLSSCREELAAPLLGVTDEYFKESSVNFRGISALLVAGIYYLVLQSKKNDGKMCGIDLNTMEGKGLIKAAIKEIIVSAFKEKL